MGEVRRHTLEGTPRRRARRRRRGRSDADTQQTDGPPLLDLQARAGNNAVARLVEGSVQREPAVADPPVATDRPLLKEGAKGDDVIQMKMELNVAGAEPPVVMGSDFDAATTEAVKKFQASHKLDVDGQCGPNTWRVLDAIGRDRVSSKDEMTEVRVQMAKEEALISSGDWAGAKAILLPIYASPTMVPEVRSSVVWDLATCEHHLGNFDAAASYYQEYLEAPSIGAMDRRDADQRLRECRLQQPPGKSESAQTADRTDQALKDRPEATDRPTLKEGAKGDDVIQLKMELNVAGADPPVVMGSDYDAATTAAVKSFQSSHGLDVDGEAGPKTWGMLDAIGRDRVSSKEEMAEVRTQMAAIEALETAGDWVGAAALLLPIYKRPTMVPEVRSSVVWDLATAEHHLGHFDAALSFYQEYLDAPQLGAIDRRDADQRMRECRLNQPPGKSESAQTADRTDQALKDRPEATDRPLLTGGERSDDVVQMKMELNAAGLDPPVAIGGTYDAETTDAVKRFQASHGLDVDGQCGPKTWGMLDAIARDRVSSKEEMAEVRTQMATEDALIKSGDWEGAKTILLSVYARPTMVPEVRSSVVWDLATCEHHLGNFEAAASLYQEYLNAPQVGAMDRRDADQRLRQCRLKQLPGKSESALNEERAPAATG